MFTHWLSLYVRLLTVGYGESSKACPSFGGLFLGPSKSLAPATFNRTLIFFVATPTGTVYCIAQANKLIILFIRRWQVNIAHRPFGG